MMKKLLVFLLFAAAVSAQQKITVEQIYTGQFRPKGMDELQALPHSNQYTVLNSGRSQTVDLYDFATLKKVSTLLDTKDFSGLEIDSYSFSDDEKQLLIASNSNPIYRHSFTADFYLYNIGTKKLEKLFEQVQEPTFSPDGKKIAYVRDNNLYVYDIA